jgi:outer membrane protein W
MKNVIVITIFLAVVACIELRESNFTYADGLYKSFSLGYGSLNPGANDKKAPSPKVLTAKYGFSFANNIRPYVGTGLAYSIPPDVKPGDTLQRIKTGVAGQAGFKFQLDSNT